VTETPDVANPFEPVTNASESSNQQHDRVVRNAYRSVQEWLKGDGYASVDDQSGEFWRGTNGCEPLPIATMHSSKFDCPLLAPVTVRNQQGTEITFTPGMTPTEVIAIIQPLPDSIHELWRLDKSLTAAAGIRRSLQLEGDFDGKGPLYFGSFPRMFGPVPYHLLVTSKLFPHHLLRLHFEGTTVPLLKRIELLDGSYLMWLRYSHGEDTWNWPISQEESSTWWDHWTTNSEQHGSVPSFPSP
jgi:hypothetical protein